MGQCKSHSHIAEQDNDACMSARPVTEKAEKKGRLFRWAFPWKSKKASIKTQQSPCRNDSMNPHDNNNTSLTVTSVNEENNSSGSTSNHISWNNEEEIINLSLKGNTGDILQHYEPTQMLGRGSYGNVFEGIRLSDSRKVALKYVVKTESMENVRIGLFGKSLPQEVAMMVLLNKGPCVPQIINLLDWYETPNDYVLVLERPTPSEDMQRFLLQRDGRITESKARDVMHQVVIAARTCCERGVFHSDIKLENLLINPHTLQVKLIDFGCSRRLKTSAYSTFSGTRVYAPPESVNHKEYCGKPATAYSLGVLLCKMLSGKYPRKHIFTEIWYTEEISKECRDLISSCMQKNPARRIHLEKILLHDWFIDSTLNLFFKTS